MKVVPARCVCVCGGIREGYSGDRRSQRETSSDLRIYDFFLGIKKAADESEMVASVDWKSCGRFAAGGR